MLLDHAVGYRKQGRRNFDRERPKKAADDKDEARTEQARQVLEEHAAELREMIKTLRKRLFN